MRRSWCHLSFSNFFPFYIYFYNLNFQVQIKKKWTNKNRKKQSKEIRTREHWWEYVLSLTFVFLGKTRQPLFIHATSTFCSTTIFINYKNSKNKCNNDQELPWSPFPHGEVQGTLFSSKRWCVIYNYIYYPPDSLYLS